jgi:acetyl esterase/lipase
MADAILNYNPEGNYKVRAYDVTYREDQDGAWLARIYQPEGAGPFPALIDVHGGAWNRGGYTNNELIDQTLAASGIVVAGIMLRRAPKHPYPAQVADVNYATRWLKIHAGEFNGDARLLGGLGTSSGGHTIMLSALRPADQRYGALPLAGAEGVDATLSYALLGWPVLDSYARYVYAKENNRAQLVESTEAYFLNEETMKEGNPQLVLERGEQAALPPVLIVQGTNDDNVPLSIPRKFVETYHAAGGVVEIEWFPDMPHGFGSKAGAEADRAMALMKAFVARQLNGSQTAAKAQGSKRSAQDSISG